MSRIPRPAGPNPYNRAAWANQPLPWQQIVGNVLGVLWILYGALVLLIAVAITRLAEGDSFGSDILGPVAAGVGFCAGIFGCVYILIGVGILLKWSWVPIVVYIVCGLTIFFELVRFMQMGSAVVPMAAQDQAVSVASGILAIAFAGFQIYIISVTKDAY